MKTKNRGYRAQKGVPENDQVVKPGPVDPNTIPKLIGQTIQQMYIPSLI